MHFPLLRLRASRPLLLVLCLVLGGLLVAVGPSAIARAQSASRIHFIPRSFGVSLGLDRAYYPEGSTAKLTFLMQNDTDRGAHGWCGSRGGNGCTFRITIEDIHGNVVNSPDSGCFFAETTLPLHPGGMIERHASAPLVYMNSDLGPDGDPLPSGSYRICLALCYYGPQPELERSLPGTNPLVCVPIQIETE